MINNSNIIVDSMANKGADDMSEKSFKACERYFPTREEAEDFAKNSVEEATTRDDIKSVLLSVAMGSWSGVNFMEKIEAVTDGLFKRFDITYKKGA